MPNTILMTVSESPLKNLVVEKFKNFKTEI